MNAADPSAQPDWLSAFPPLAAIDADSRKLLVERARLVSLPAQARVFAEGDSCGNYLLVVEGSVRVQKVAENGREILLYRVDRGESCVLTTNCLMSRQDYSAEATTESEVKAIALPRAVFDDLLARSAGFREFVFASYAARLADLLMLIEEVAFGRIDSRLAQFLIERKDGAGEIQGTHQDIAAELGTAREVVSRQLKEFERKGWVQLQRGRLAVTDAAALNALIAKGKF